MPEHKVIAEMLEQAMIDNKFGRIRVVLGPINISIRPTRYYADTRNPSIYGIKVRGADLLRPTIDDVARRIADIAHDYGIDVPTELPDHIRLCGAYKKQDRKWNYEPKKKSIMKGVNAKSAMDMVSTNVTPQKHKEKVEKELMEFVKKYPITIEYGCHTIELKEDSRYSNGFSFRAKKDNGKGIIIEIN